MSEMHATMEGRHGPRTYPLRMPPGWTPPYPSWESEFGAAREVAMAVVGCQFAAGERARARTLLEGLLASLRGDGAADHVDLALCEEDGTGAEQLVATAYWLDGGAMADYFGGAPFRVWWTRAKVDQPGIGIFRELFNIPLRRFETLHSGPDHVVGVAHARRSLSGVIREHAYWGGMRDRIPDSGIDRFEPGGALTVAEVDGEMVVSFAQNVAVIRSGQDLKAATGTERQEYYGAVEPTLRAGMAFLRDRGAEVGCLDCRYMAFVGEDGEATDHTFGLAYFRSLADLEAWAEHHPTHLAIFNAFLEFAPRYGPAMKSRYWHEVSVLPAEAQVAVYANCRPGTGFTAAGGARS